MANIQQRICFSAPTASDVLLDLERKNEFQDLLVFFGVDYTTGNVVLFCIDQIYNLEQLNSLVYIRDHTGLEFTNKENCNGSYGFSSWKTSSLQLQCVVPMQTWRIVFNGHLRNGDEYKHVKVNFLWKPLGFPVYCNTNNEFFKHEIDNVQPDINLLGFDQFGQISGAMVVDGKTEMTNIRAMKLRRWNMSKNDLVFVGFSDCKSMSCIIQKLERMKNCRGHLKTILEHYILTPSEICFSYEHNDDSSTIAIKHQNFNLNVSLKNRTPATVTLNNVSVETSFGNYFQRILLRFRNEPKNKVEINQRQITINDCISLTLNLDSEMCSNSGNVGNKAKSLFLLKKAITNNIIYNASVPDGICVTTIAMRNHIINNKNLSVFLNDTIEMAKKSDYKQLLDHSERLKNQWLSSKISTELYKAISNDVRETGTYAVRSSGIFEDGEVTSSAGQYVTKLGCSGHPNEITTAILECWSSNFSAQALTYRKNNGQPLMCLMAVVIQDQVKSQIAGVAFTRDPNTGDPEKITIAACVGLGEGVVSGSVEPDMILIPRPRMKIDYDPSSGPSTTLSEPIRFTADFIEENDNSDNAKVQCISKTLLKKLAGLCVEIEDVFNSPQDIEWAVLKDEVYLLQSRPITSIFVWSNNEISTEFDSPFTTDSVTMFYNVKEVYPYPMHPLSLTLDFFSTNQLMHLSNEDLTDIYSKKNLLFTNFNMCLSVDRIFQHLEHNTPFMKVIEYSIAGKSFVTSEIFEKISMKKHISAIEKFFNSLLLFKNTLNLESKVVETQELVYSVNLKQSKSASDLLIEINNSMDVLEKATHCHMSTSTNNILTHTLLAMTGLDFHKDWTIQNLINLSVSVKTPDIVNVSILKDIQVITKVISEIPSKKKFCNLPVQECNDWLKFNCDKSYGLVMEFIKNYGHRGVQELDFGSETWSTDPNRLFSYIQSLILSSNHCQPLAKKIKNSAIVRPQGYIKKKTFDYLLKRYQQSITYRERSKDILVQIVHKLRLGYIKLGEKLVEEGKIPDFKLVFFMSQYEVRKICDNNYPEVVHKALKRRKLWPTLTSLQFDDINFGLPIPNLLNEESIDRSTQLLQGCCVFPGQVKNRACVLEHINDACYLQHGDILIVKSIDIAWSPYFPIISGLVTEIGGIISHGAVIAREYSLPCLVGVQNAKKYFKTGDMVILDSEKGFVTKHDTTN